MRKMRAFVVSPVYPPEPIVSSQTSTQLVEELMRRGHQVTVITAFPSKPAGKLYAGYRRRLMERQRTKAGLDVVRCFSFLSTESRMASRLLENLSFGVTSSLALLVARRPDVIYANTWPIVATGLVNLVAHLRRIPMVISVQDVYPESLVSQRRLGANHLLIRAMRWLDQMIARNCQEIIVISESFASVYRNRRHIPTDRVHYVPNWGDHTAIIPGDERASFFRASHNIPEHAFVVMYGGNVGMAARVEVVVEAFHYLQTSQDIYLVIAGDGSSLATCRQLANQLDVQRIIFHSPWLSAETSMALSAADVLVLPTRGEQSLASVPSKLITYLFAAKPVIALALPESDLARSIERAGCGWVIAPDQPELLADQIRVALDTVIDERDRLGQRGRAFALQHFSSEVCLSQIMNVISRAASAGGRSHESYGSR